MIPIAVHQHCASDNRCPPGPCILYMNYPAISQPSPQRNGGAKIGDLHASLRQCCMKTQASILAKESAQRCKTHSDHALEAGK